MGDAGSQLTLIRGKNVLNKCRAITDSQEHGVHVSLPLISADQGQSTLGEMSPANCMRH